MDDFEIRDGILIHYHGPGGHVMIPSGVRVIGQGAFSFQKDITKVTLPSGVTTIEEEAFAHCHRLNSIHIPGSVTSIGASVFCCCYALEQIRIPEGVTEIGPSAFQECLFLQEVYLPQSLRSIGDDAFWQCLSLTKINVPQDGVSIGAGAFRLCKSLTDSQGFVIKGSSLFQYLGLGGHLVVPEGITTIENGAFYDCPHITKMTLPESITAIGHAAFHGCKNLTEINIPQGVKLIQDEAFYGCDGLADANGFIIVDNTLFDYIGSGGDVVIPQGVTTISRYAFDHCRDLTAITIPDSVTRLNSYVFDICANLTKVHILGQLESLGDELFWWNEDLVITAPCTSFALFLNKNLTLEPLKGYLLHPEEFQDPAIIQEYRAYIQKHWADLLSWLFQWDCPQGLSVLAETGILTAETFEETFLRPAQEAQATGCIAFLLNWKEQHRSPQDLPADFIL